MAGATWHRLKSPERCVATLAWSTPLSSKNLDNRELAPACELIKQPRVTWYSFRHTHATLLAEVGDSIKTAQPQLGHSDLGARVNTCAHVIPDSQRHAVERVAEGLFSDVLKLDDGAKNERFNPQCSQDLQAVGGPARIRTLDQRIMSPLL
jgi:hypothetical protein